MEKQTKESAGIYILVVALTIGLFVYGFVVDTSSLSITRKAVLMPFGCVIYLLVLWGVFALYDKYNNK